MTAALIIMENQPLQPGGYNPLEQKLRIFQGTKGQQNHRQCRKDIEFNFRDKDLQCHEKECSQRNQNIDDIHCNQSQTANERFCHRKLMEDCLAGIETKVND